MIQPQIKWIYCADHDPLKEWEPDDLETFYLAIQVGIGATEVEGDETFQFEIVSPKWLIRNRLDFELQSDKILGFPYLWGRGFIVLWEWRYQNLEHMLNQLCDLAVGPDWDSVAEVLRRFGYWEFEDYHELDLSE